MAAYSYRYHFCIIQCGIRTKCHVNANNPMSAYSKAKRCYPMADKIHLVRSDKLY